MLTSRQLYSVKDEEEDDWKPPAIPAAVTASAKKQSRRSRVRLRLYKKKLDFIF